MICFIEYKILALYEKKLVQIDVVDVLCSKHMDFLKQAVGKLLIDIYNKKICLLDKLISNSYRWKALNCF
jgi:hypothetical protein